MADRYILYLAAMWLQRTQLQIETLNYVQQVKVIITGFDAFVYIM